jgi:poly-gamma-glutamate synthesis protein (capsule biosynthesis protein)
MSGRHATTVLASVLSVLLAVISCDTPAPRTGESPVAEEQAIRLTLLGDVMFGRWRGGRYKEHRDNATLKALAEASAGADLTLANLETAVCSKERAQRVKRPDRAIALTAPESALRGLERLGVDVASVANNHALDCGPGSLVRTRRALARRGIAAAGAADRPAITRTVGGRTVTLFAATIHAPRLSFEPQNTPYTASRHRFDRLVDAVARRHDRHPDRLLVVSIHWGHEGAAKPSDWQRRAAGDLVEAGAEIVWGHGSHTVQPVEQVDGALVAYSLGNAHFDMAGERAVLDVRCRSASDCRGTVRRVGGVDR